MMKKLLVLALVLSVASLASATMSLSVSSTEVNVGEVALVTVSNDVATNWLGYIIVEDGGVGALANPTAIIALSPGLSGSNPYAEAGWGVGFDFTTAADAPAVPVAGAQWTFDFSSLVEGSAIISLWDGNGTFGASEDAIAMTVVPEPATMALLGLGALVLRRKK